MKRLALLVASVFAIACGGTPTAPTPEPVPVEQRPEPQKPAAQEDRVAAFQAAKAEKEKQKKTYAYQLERVQKDIDGALKVANKNPKSWLGLDRAANAYLAKARLTGDYADYAKAQELIDKSFTIMKVDFGPFMTRARLNFTLHRLDRVDEDFARQLRDPAKKASAKAVDLAFAANLAFQRGKYDEALKFYEESIALHPTAAQTGLAVYKWKTGDFDGAEELFNEAIAAHRGDDTEPVAWAHLMLGLMDLDRGRYDDALAHYKTAESFIVGYWLIDEHIAEILTLQGKTDEAITLYEDIVARTNSPEFMDALAGIWRERGDEAKATAWIAKADARYQEQLAMFPEAAYGHALDHYLEFGEDPKQTLAMAEKNHALRPNAEAKASLAAAQLAAGDTKKAKATIEAALKTPYTTADLHLTAAEIYRAVGDETRSAEQVAKAQAINPKAELEPASDRP
jgi:tetratricopeptide (TPR) repeat protein